MGASPPTNRCACGAACYGDQCRQCWLRTARHSVRKCGQCGRSFQPRKPSNLWCSRACSNRARGGERHWNWQGGTGWIDDKGYRRLSNTRFEHQAVMEQVLTRPLRPGETVHHRNGIRDDNRPSNLELWSSNHPAGQRIEDLVSWARDLLDQYEPEMALLQGATSD